LKRNNWHMWVEDYIAGKIVYVRLSQVELGHMLDWVTSNVRPYVRLSQIPNSDESGHMSRWVRSYICQIESGHMDQMESVYQIESGHISDGFRSYVILSQIIQYVRLSQVIGQTVSGCLLQIDWLDIML
jgi:hypothetical protein